MNNILSFTEYNGQELETIVYDYELNEGLRKFLNKRATRQVRAELAEEIEMSKSIMDGIKSGLESLNDDFDVLRKGLDKVDDNQKGEKQKSLDSIMKILEDSRKNTWDLNQLIDEGEIDYTGFTANIGIASVSYFGILFTPFRAIVMMHKGYNYFFTVIKNTIRKALVMLQLNFDQFENLIITKGFQSLDYLQDQDTSVKISEFYGKLQAKLFDEKTGMMKGKRGSEFAKQQMQLAKNQIDAMMKADKSRKLSDNAYNCLDQYNNTYTRSLETLRQYTQDDVQKQLDSIKNSMNKLAGQEADLQTYSELLIAAAEEHAYKVSSSIYNKFAKMTEVFSLPNQKKLIDLIQAATKEQMDAEEKIKEENSKKLNMDKAEEEVNKLNESGSKIFSDNGGKLGEIDKEKNEYSSVDVQDFTYEKYKDLSDEDKDKFETWVSNHNEVLKELDNKIKVHIDAPFNDICESYIDSLVDYIGPCVEASKHKESKKNESHILNFDQYLFEASGEEAGDEDIEREELTDEEKEELDKELKGIEKNLNKLLKVIFGVDDIDIEDFEVTPKMAARLDYVIEKCGEGVVESEDSDESSDDEIYVEPAPVKRLKSIRRIFKNNQCYLNFSKDNIDSTQLKIVKELYKDKEVAIVALKVIGKKVLKDNTFIKNSSNLVDIINKCVKDKKRSISLMTYTLLSESIKVLKDLRSHDYARVENENNTKKSDE